MGLAPNLPANSPANKHGVRNLAQFFNTLLRPLAAFLGDQARPVDVAGGRRFGVIFLPGNGRVRNWLVRRGIFCRFSKVVIGGAPRNLLNCKSKFRLATSSMPHSRCWIVKALASDVFYSLHFCLFLNIGAGTRTHSLARGRRARRTTCPGRIA
jgi:hypothetical protein